MTKKLSFLILAATFCFNLWLNYPESKILADPNDNIFQFSLVGRTNWVWGNYGCPLSLSCIPNLIDHVVPNWAEGYPLPFYYSHVPQIVTVASYNLIAKPILSLISYPLSLFQYYTFTRYLLLSLFPLSVFIALRIVGFSPVPAALGALFSAFFSTDGLYGIDPPSYLWRGYGLTSQLYAIIFLPLGIAFTYKALLGDEKHKSEIRNPCLAGPLRRIEAIRQAKSEKISNDENSKFKFSRFVLRASDLSLAVLFLTLTTAGHLGIGIIGLFSTIPFLLFDLNPRNIWLRIKKLFLISITLIIILAYWIIPILLKDNYHIISFWDPIWKFNSYGWYEVVRQFFAGEIFDWQRLPIITGLVLIGFFVLLTRSKRHSGDPPIGGDSRIRMGSWTSQDDNLYVFSLLFVFMMLFYFGSTTWGGLLNIIPGMKDFHQHRFIVGAHIAALFLIPAGLEYTFFFIRRGLARISARPRLEESLGRYQNIIFYILTFIFISLLIYLTAGQTISYAKLNNRWIDQANNAYLYDYKNFQNLLTEINSLPPGRIYAGRPGNWGKDFRLGSTQLYLLMGGIGYDISQFLPETWSPLSENEQDFDERENLDYNLLNIKYVIAPKNEGFAPGVKLADKFGPFQLFQSPTTGWFDVVTSPMFVVSDKTNYINLVHLWWNSYARRWNMYPLISVEKNPAVPAGMEKIITMTDEVSYQESDKDTPGVAGIQGFPRGGRNRKNIFADFPFVFPEATISAQIKNETVYRQSYSATVEVPANCSYCYAMFKMSYHPDWTVKVDGHDASTYAVFPFYLATPITPGTHTVEFTYKPNRLKIILLAGEIILGMILIIFRKKIISGLK